MERIKKAIENAKKIGPDGAVEVETSDQENKESKQSSSLQQTWTTVKWVVAAVTISLAGSAWFHLDYMNKRELQESAQLCNGIEEARAEGKRRALIEAKFASLITANLKYCKASAEKTRNDYVKFVQDSVLIENEAALSRYNEKSALIKPAKFYIPKATISETTEMLEAAQAECQQIYDMQLKSSK